LAVTYKAQSPMTGQQPTRDTLLITLLGQSDPRSSLEFWAATSRAGAILKLISHKGIFGSEVDGLGRNK
jgi:hypothetical protein